MLWLNETLDLSSEVWLNSSWEHSAGTCQDFPAVPQAWLCPWRPKGTRGDPSDRQGTKEKGQGPSPVPVPVLPVPYPVLTGRSPAAIWRPRPPVPGTLGHSRDREHPKKQPPVLTAPRSHGRSHGRTAHLSKAQENLGLSKLSLFQMLKDEFFVLSALINQPKYIFFFKKSSPF